LRGRSLTQWVEVAKQRVLVAQKNQHIFLKQRLAAQVNKLFILTQRADNKIDVPARMRQKPTTHTDFRWSSP
jgi:hypothetical protein